jgi:hypothetical protein
MSWHVIFPSICREVNLSLTHLTSGQAEAVLRAVVENSGHNSLNLSGLKLSQVPADLLANAVAGVRYGSHFMDILTFVGHGGLWRNFSKAF